MNSFLQESAQIQKAELKQREDLYRTKEFFEDFYPNYFNTISIWAGIITLISFFFINREVRMRIKYQAELEKKLQELVGEKVTFEVFFQRATLNPNAHLITGTICGYRVEEIENPLTQQVRHLDKLVDELAKGRKMEKILRI